MQPLFDLSFWAIIEVRPGAPGQILHSPGDHKWET